MGKHYFITEKIISYHHHQGLWGRRRDDKYLNAIRNPKRVSSSDGQGAIQLVLKSIGKKRVNSKLFLIKFSFEMPQNNGKKEENLSHKTIMATTSKKNLKTKKLSIKNPVYH